MAANERNEDNNEKKKFIYIKQRANKDQDDEHCHHATCKDVKDEIKSWMKKSGKECPVDRQALGRNTWSLLHTIAARYPNKPSIEQKRHMHEFIALIGSLYPCRDCAIEFQKDIKDLPPQVDSQQELSQWFCKVHNLVNKRLRKPEFDCSKIDERWRTGWKDGSCDM